MSNHRTWSNEAHDYVDTHCVCHLCRAHFEPLQQRIKELEAEVMASRQPSSGNSEASSTNTTGSSNEQAAPSA